MNIGIWVDKKEFWKYNLFVTRFNKSVINEKYTVTVTGEYMTNRLFKTFGLFCFCAAMMAAVPGTALADQEGPEYQTSTSMLVRVEETNADVYSEPDESSEIVGQAVTGDTYDVLEMIDGQWARISTEDFEGFLNTVKAAATVAENVEEVAVESEEELAERLSSERRDEIVEYALQFVGNKYVYGGTNPNKGADCSGFTSYVMKQAGGVELPHSSKAQSGKGRVVSASEIRPGDLIFYGSGKSINHVAMYIGDGQIVHASNERNGILVSDWMYRKPVKIVNVLGD